MAPPRILGRGSAAPFLLILAAWGLASCARLAAAEDAAAPAPVEAPPAPPAFPAPIILGVDSNQTAITARALQIYDTWARIYGLEGANDLPPLPETFPDSFQKLGKDGPTRAPHLEACSEVSAQRAAAENFGNNGALPDWFGGPRSPQPPWVAGGDLDNLAKTRQAQADIWRSQFPADCNSPGLRFLVAEWLPAGGRPAPAAQIHAMAWSLGVAMAHGRILVPLPGGFEPAAHDACQGEERGALSCYFFPATPSNCAGRALNEYEQLGKPPLTNDTALMASHLDGPASVIGLPISLLRSPKFDAAVPTKWGTPWLGQPATHEVMGEPRHLSKAQWWGAQAARFLLRWPSPRLCHLSNAARHGAYGLHVSRKVAESERGRALAISRSNEVKGPQEANELAGIDLRRAPLEETLWLPVEPYVPRPVLGVHVADGRGAFSLAAHMVLAERVRWRHPGARTAWLSAESQKSAEQSTAFAGRWTFLSTRRGGGGGRQLAEKGLYELTVGVATSPVERLVDLAISAQCDHFVGALSSDWAALVNALRMTTGRLRGEYFGLDDLQD